MLGLQLFKLGNMRFAPVEIDQLMTLLAENPELPTDGSPDWKGILATESIFKRKILRILWNGVVGPGSLRVNVESLASHTLTSSDLLRPKERAARAQDMLRWDAYRLYGTRGRTVHRFTMLEPKGNAGFVSCEEKIEWDDHELTRLWTRFGNETFNDQDPGRKWVHQMARMIGPQSRLISVTHATGWVLNKEGLPEIQNQWVECFSTEGHLNHVVLVRDGEPDLVLDEDDPKNQPLLVKADPFGLITGVERYLQSGELIKLSVREHS